MKDKEFVIEGYRSHCCGEEMTGLQSDYEICPQCKDHCTVMVYDKDDNEKKLEDV